MSPHARLLFVDDDAAHVERTVADIVRAGIETEHRVAATAEELDAALQETWSAVVASPRAGDPDAREALRIVRTHNAELPFIFAGNGDVATALVHEMENASARSEARLAAALENAPIGVVQGDTRGYIVVANRRFCEMLGYSCAEIIGKHFNVFSHPDDASKALERFNELVQDGRPVVRYERRYVHKQGHTIWATVTLSRIDDRGASVIAVIEDVSDRKLAQAVAEAEAIERERARAALVESEARYRSVVEGASEIIFTTDVAGRFLSLNAAFEKITGLKAADWIGRKSSDLVAVVEGGYSPGVIRRVINEHVALASEVWIAGRDRNVLVDMLAVPKIENGKTTAVFGFARDITESRRAEHERSQLARKLELLLQSTIEGIFAVDADGRCTLINRAGAALLGRPAESFAGEDMNALLRDGSALNPTHDVIRSGIPCTITNDTFRRADGTTFPVEYSASPIVEHGVLIGVVVSFTDVTEQRKLEGKVAQANRMTSLGRVAATIAHEFNNVLMGISPFIEVLRRGASPEKTSIALEHIGNAIRRGKRVTDEILRFTQPKDPVITPVAVEKWLRGIELDARSMLTPDKYTLAVTMDDAGLVIAGDANQLHQVFVNLVINARDAMPAGGPIVVRVCREAHAAHFIVEDAGCGMDAETARQIFEPLFTTKKNGTGLGLAVAQQVVHRHNGEISVESEPGAGSRFHVFIPLADSKAERTRVLLVENELALASSIAALMEMEGISVEVAETASDGIAASLRWKPDIAVIDLDLADDDHAAQFRTMFAEIPVIFCTGDTLDTRLADLAARPRVTILVKPYETAELCAAIRSALREPQ